MSIKIAVFFACFIVGGCAKPRPVPPVSPSLREFHTAPEAMRATHRLACGGGAFRGLGTAYGATMMVTAYHVIEKCQSIEWIDVTGQRGFLIVAKFDQKRDWAILVLQEGSSFNYWTSVTTEEPRNGERLWSFVVLPGEVLRPVSDVYIGADGSGDIHTSSLSHPGSSGSGIYNGAGELVGIVNGSYGYSIGNRTLYGTLSKWIFKG